MRVKHIAEKGKGVFAQKRYVEGELVLCHEILAVPDDEADKIQKTFLDNYLFLINDVYFIALGQGSLINHSADPNLYYTFRKRKQQIEFYALRPIKKGEEFTIDYEWDSYPWEETKG